MAAPHILCQKHPYVRDSTGQELQKDEIMRILNGLGIAMREIVQMSEDFEGRCWKIRGDARSPHIYRRSGV
ncbi:hypothetical protein J6590_055362 [Homalodisca vitripennis]|nr:hypothetical protein J6590_055362 [Homalodisca vitripennis]